MVTVSTIVTQFVEGFTDFVGGIGSGIAGLFTQLFTETVGETTSLSTFGIWSIVLLCIGLGMSLLYGLISMIRNRG